MNKRILLFASAVVALTLFAGGVSATPIVEDVGTECGEVWDCSPKEDLDSSPAQVGTECGEVWDCSPKESFDGTPAQVGTSTDVGIECHSDDALPCAK